MTKKEFAESVAIASDASIENLFQEDIDIFNGFGLHGFRPLFATKKQLAGLIRWQCLYLSGGFDMQAMQEIFDCLKRKLTIVG